MSRSYEGAHPQFTKSRLRAIKSFVDTNRRQDHHSERRSVVGRAPSRGQIMVNRSIAAIAGSIALVASFWAGPLAATAVPSSAHESTVASVGVSQPAARALQGAVTDVCAGLESGFGCRLQGQSRVALGHGVSEYNYQLRVGPDPHDLIGLHRVIEAAESGVPYQNPHAIMFIHGDVWGFDPAFAGKLGGRDRAPNVATWMAARGVDVWGIDLRWVLVPASTHDRSFMRGWGSAVDVRDIRVATTVERTIRSLTGSGSGRTALLGWSRGGFLAYAYANYETHLASRLRNVDALIPADTVLRFSPQFDQYRQHACTYYRDAKQTAAHGSYAADDRVYLRLGGTGVEGSDGQVTFHS